MTQLRAQQVKLNAMLTADGSNAIKIADDGVGSSQLGILTTKGDLLVFGSAPTRLGVGSDRKFLIADSAQSEGLRWDTILGATKGNLITSSTTGDVVLNVGSDGQILVADSAQTVGIKWASPSTIYTASGMQDIEVAAGQLNGNSTAQSMIANETFACYLGQATRAYTSVDIMIRMRTSGSISWMELAIAKGTPVLNGTPSLTSLGFVDITSQVTTTGFKVGTVSLSGVAAGDHLWFLVGSSSSLQVDAATSATDTGFSTGLVVSATARPSTMGSPTSFSTARTVPTWNIVKWT